MSHAYEAAQRSDAREVLRALALGMHPDTLERIRDAKVLEIPSVIRSLLLAVEALTDHDIRPDPKSSEPDLGRAGMPWSPEEDAQLREEFENRTNLVLLAELHERTQGAIVARLTHLKLAGSRDEVRALLAWS